MNRVIIPESFSRNSYTIVLNREPLYKRHQGLGQWSTWKRRYRQWSTWKRRYRQWSTWKRRSRAHFRSGSLPFGAYARRQAHTLSALAMILYCCTYLFKPVFIAHVTVRPSSPARHHWHGSLHTTINLISTFVHLKDSSRFRLCHPSYCASQNLLYCRYE